MPWTTPGTATAGEVLTAAFWNTNVRDNTNELYGSIRRLGYVTRTTDYSITANTVGAATDLFSSDLTFTAIAATAYRVEFYCPYLSTGTGAGDNARIHLCDGSGNDLGLMSFVGNGDGTRRAENQVFAIYNYTPGAGSISLNIRPIKGGGNGNLGGGTGGSGQNMPAYLAVYGPAIT